MRIGVVGSGTAGLVAALLLKKAFPNSFVDVISSSSIGIVGVGEGSTEHWARFMRIMGISPFRLLSETDATHKVGIRFEGWTTHTPSYFHAIRGGTQRNEFDYPMTYSGAADRDVLISSITSVLGVDDGFVTGDRPHTAVNQFHFDTFKLNEFLISCAKVLSINFIDGELTGLVRNLETGNIEKLLVSDFRSVDVDFVVDASGLRREVMGRLGNDKWVSFKDFLLADSAVAGPSESDETGKVLPFTRAIACDAGWMWEIPTQSRRGNGYVYSSAHLLKDDAVRSLIDLQHVDESRIRHFSFDPGYLRNPWFHNCCAIGLSGSFVEPLEATSISTGINQTLMLIQHLAGYDGNNTIGKSYNHLFSEVMQNILDMIRLHYISDNAHSEFWTDAKSMPIPDSLAWKLEAWQHRMPLPSDFTEHWGLFKDLHFFHVAQGQGLIGKQHYKTAIDRFNQRQIVEKELETLIFDRVNAGRISHAEALKQISETANNTTLWGNSQAWEE
jgi:tryptophan 7-halogenase